MAQPRPDILLLFNLSRRNLSPAIISTFPRIQFLFFRPVMSLPAPLSNGMYVIILRSVDKQFESQVFAIIK
jgi:hypothetical protein